MSGKAEHYLQAISRRTIISSPELFSDILAKLNGFISALS